MNVCLASICCVIPLAPPIFRDLGIRIGSLLHSKWAGMFFKTVWLFTPIIDLAISSARGGSVSGVDRANNWSIWSSSSLTLDAGVDGGDDLMVSASQMMHECYIRRSKMVRTPAVHDNQVLPRDILIQVVDVNLVGNEAREVGEILQPRKIPLRVLHSWLREPWPWKDRNERFFRPFGFDGRYLAKILGIQVLIFIWLLGSQHICCRL